METKHILLGLGGLVALSLLVKAGKGKVSPCICNYVNERGIVTDQLVLKAQDDYAAGILPLSCNVDIINYWETQQPVTTCL